MSRKSQTIGDFTFCRPSQILSIFRIICPRFSRDARFTCDTYDFEFSLGKIWDSRETVKSPTIGDFTVSRRSQILSTNENSKSWISPIVWDENKSGESGAFLFPDASQFSAMIGDHSRQIKTQNCTVGLPLETSAMGFAHYQSPKLLGSSPPITQVSIFCALSISGQIHRENLRQTCKSKILDRLGFSDM